MKTERHNSGRVQQTRDPENQSIMLIDRCAGFRNKPIKQRERERWITTHKRLKRQKHRIQKCACYKTHVKAVQYRMQIADTGTRNHVNNKIRKLAKTTYTA